MILEILFTLFAATVGYILVGYFIHLLRLKEYPPGPCPLPLIGNLHLISSSQSYKSLNKLAKTYGPVMSFSFGTQRIVVIQGIKEAKEMLVTKGQLFAGRPQDDLTGQLISNGHKDIAFSDYTSTLKAMRKIAHGALKAYGDGLVKLEQSVLEEADALFKRFDKKNGEGFDPMPDLCLSVVNVICAIIFGKRYSDDDEEFQRILNAITLIFSFDMSAPVSHIPLLKYLPSSALADLKRGIEMRDNILARVVTEHKECFDPETLRDFTDFIISETKKQALEDKTMQNLVDDVNLQQILSDLFMAGVETTATMLTWTFAFLATYPDVQRRVAEERRKIIGDRMPRLSDRGSLPYFEAMILEALRMGSVAALAIPHKALQNTECGGHKIPAGTQIWYNIWALHYDEKEWKEPLRFNPERFLDKEGKLVRTTDQSFLPFGAGRRVCIGEALARMELFVFLSNILWKYDIAPDGELPDLDGVMSLVLKPKPFKVKLSPH